MVVLNFQEVNLWNLLTSDRLDGVQGIFGLFLVMFVFEHTSKNGLRETGL